MYYHSYANVYQPIRGCECVRNKKTRNSYNTNTLASCEYNHMRKNTKT